MRQREKNNYLHQLMKTLLSPTYQIDYSRSERFFSCFEASKIIRFSYFRTAVASDSVHRILQCLRKLSQKNPHWIFVLFKFFFFLYHSFLMITYQGLAYLSRSVASLASILSKGSFLLDIQISTEKTLKNDLQSAWPIANGVSAEGRGGPPTWQAKCKNWAPISWHFEN